MTLAHAQALSVTAAPAIVTPVRLPSERTLQAPSQTTVRLARANERESVFRLRYDVFYTEMGAQNDAATESTIGSTQLPGNSPLGLDVDAYDDLCDHLVVLHSGVIVGTYRLLPLRRLKGTGMLPYSASEFDVSAIGQAYGDDILELGRSCVHPDFRTGLVPRLLWGGIAQYMLLHRVKALYGCVSVHGISDLQALRLRDALHEQNRWDSRFDAAVQAPFAPSPEAVEAYAEHGRMVPEDPMSLMPPLMKGYFNLGAKICGGPAHDEPFHCHDYLMLLDTGAISPKYFKALVQPFVEQKIIDMS